MHNIVLERLYLINLGRKQKNPSTLHHTVKVKFAEFEVIYCMGWLMWFGAKRHFLPGSIDAQYCSGAFIFNKSWQKTKKSFNSSPYRQGQICRIWSNILYGMTDVVWRKKTGSIDFFFFFFWSNILYGMTDVVWTFFFFFFFFFFNWKRMRWL